MKQDIQDYVGHCLVCQQNKAMILSLGWILSMDFVEGLLKSEGNDAILVVVDRLSKYAHLLGCNIPSPHIQWLLFSLEKWFVYLGCQKPLFLTAIKSFLAIFGLNFSVCRVLSLNIAPPITHRPMGKLKWSITALKHTFGVFRVLNLEHGHNG